MKLPSAACPRLGEVLTPMPFGSPAHEMVACDRIATVVAVAIGDRSCIQKFSIVMERDLKEQVYMQIPRGRERRI
jgi:hypothetical protein